MPHGDTFRGGLGADVLELLGVLGARSLELLTSRRELGLAAVQFGDRLIVGGAGLAGLGAGGGRVLLGGVAGGLGRR